MSSHDFINLHHLDNLSFVPYYEDKFIERNMRYFIKTLYEAKYFNNFLLLRRFKLINNLHRNSLISWNTTWISHKYDESHGTSFKSSSTYSFKIKTLYDELPTLENLKHRRPDLYPANLLCVCCNNTTSPSDRHETIDHLWTCPSRTSVVRNIMNSCRTFLHHSISQRYPDADTTGIDSNQVWTLDHFDTYVGGLLLVRGFVPTSLFNNINVILRNKKSTQHLISCMMNKLFKMFRSDIWSPRNQLLVAYESSINITPSMKKSGISGFHPSYVVKPIGPPSHTTLYSSRSYETWVDKAIDFGNSWLDFVLSLNK